MTNYSRIEGWSELVRDNETNAIINTNSAAIRDAKLRKQIRKKAKLQLESRLDNLETEMQDIKGLLEVIANKII